MSSPQEYDPYNEEGGNQNTTIIKIDGGMIGIAIAAVALIFAILAFDRTGQAERRNIDRTTAVEKRSMDYSYLAKQEARIAQDQVRELDIYVKSKEK